MTKPIIGIDPGKQGAIAVVSPDGSPITCVKMALCLADGTSLTYSQASYRDGKLPKTRKHFMKELRIDTFALYAMVAEFAPQAVFIENQVAMGMQRGQFAVGANFGRIMGILELLRMNTKTVSAPHWKKALGLSLSKAEKKQLKAREQSRIKKERAIAKARELGYEVPGKNDNIAEAWLIAYYGVHHG